MIRHVLPAVFSFAVLCGALAGQEPPDAGPRASVSQLQQDNAQMREHCAAADQQIAQLNERVAQLEAKVAELAKAVDAATKSSSRTGNAPAKSPTADPLKTGSQWTGTRSFNDGKSGSMAMTIESRQGEEITGHITLPRGKGSDSYQFRGTARGGAIEFKTDKYGQFEQTFTGKLQGNSIEFTWYGVTMEGNNRRGTANLGPDPH